MSRTSWKGSPYIIVSLALIVAIPLFREFGASDGAGWKIFVGLLLIGLLAGAFLLSRFLGKNWDEIGEARFDTINENDR